MALRINPVEGVFPAEVWGNIIPVVTHPNGKAAYPGLNLTGDGQANLRRGLWRRSSRSAHR